MQTVVSAGLVVEHERRGLILPGLVANIQEGGMVAWISRSVFTEGFRPVIRDLGEMRICTGPECNDYFWKRVHKIFVIADAEAIPLHDHLAAKTAVIFVERNDGSAFSRR